MDHRIGDAVRLRPGSDLRELLDPWDEATGRVTERYDDADRLRINVLYGEAGPMAFGVPAAEFVRDRALDAAPF